MPLDALKHRCLQYLREQSPLIECLEQASFLDAINNEQLAEMLQISLPSDPLMRQLGSDELAAMINALRRSHFPLSIKLEILRLIVRERLATLAAMHAQTPAESAEERFVLTMYAATVELHDFVFSSKNYSQIGLFFNDYRIGVHHFAGDSFINPPPFEELFDWPASPASAAAKAAKTAFASILRGKNRRAKYLKKIRKTRSDFANLYDFFARQEEVFLSICAQAKGAADAVADSAAGADSAGAMTDSAADDAAAAVTAKTAKNPKNPSKKSSSGRPPKTEASGGVSAPAKSAKNAKTTKNPPETNVSGRPPKTDPSGGLSAPAKSAKTTKNSSKTNVSGRPSKTDPSGGLSAPAKSTTKSPAKKPTTKPAAKQPAKSPKKPTPPAN